MTQKLLTSALSSNNVQFQKVTVALENISKCLYDLAHICKDFAFLNDPLGIYYDNRKKSISSEWRNTADLGFFTNSAEIFKKDLEHLYGQLDKYINVLNKMNIPTEAIETKFSEIHQLVSEFAVGSGIENSEDEIEALYNIHDKSAPFIDSIIDIADKLENLNEFSPEIYSIKALDKISTYVPYRNRSEIITRTVQAVESEWGVTAELRQLWRLLDK